MKVIGVACGGYTSEREISLKSGNLIFNLIKDLGWIVKFICILGSVKKYTSLSDDLYHFFGIVLCYQQPKYAFKK